MAKGALKELGKDEMGVGDRMGGKERGKGSSGGGWGGRGLIRLTDHPWSRLIQLR